MRRERFVSNQSRLFNPTVLPALAVVVLLAACSAERTGDDQAGARRGQYDAADSTGGSDAHITAAVADAGRPEEDRKRDADRKPAEVLAFFGIEPGMQVVDLMGTSGYYTEILARAVGADGKVYALNAPAILDWFADEPLTKRLARLGMDHIIRFDRELEDPGLPEGLDAVLLIRSVSWAIW